MFWIFVPFKKIVFVQKMIRSETDHFAELKPSILINENIYVKIFLKEAALVLTLTQSFRTFK